MHEYEEVSVQIARAIANDLHKNIVIILSEDKEHGLVHTTTFGRDVDDKLLASDWGEKAALSIGCDLSKKRKYANFRKRPFLDLVAAERERQIEGEGFSTDHDDAHANGELADAAACYAATRELTKGQYGEEPMWPFDPSWWKAGKHDRQRQLVIAAALLCAEWDRLERTKGGLTDGR